MEKRGIVFKCGIAVGQDYPAQKLLKDFDAVCLAGGSRVPRDLKIEGRELSGIHFAMDYLIQSNRRVSGENQTRIGKIPMRVWMKVSLTPRAKGCWLLAEGIPGLIAWALPTGRGPAVWSR